MASLLLVVALTVGCGSSAVNRGVDLYAQGHYVESAEVFEHTEAGLADLDDEQRARYGLYRGATFLSLGDVARGNQWLRYSERLLAEGRAELASDEARMLRDALGTARKPLLHTAIVEGRVAAAH